MSWCATYYAGIMDTEGKIKPIGPYNDKGELKPIVERSRSFASDFYTDFYQTNEKQITPELRKEFEYEDYKGDKNLDIRYLPLDEFPVGSYLKSGYYLIEDIKDWEKNPDSFEFDGFYNMISPLIYAEKMRNWFVYGDEKPKLDEEGYECEVHNPSEYMYAVIPDYSSKEYEADIVKDICYMLMNEYEVPKGCRLVALLEEG